MIHCLCAGPIRCKFGAVNEKTLLTSRIYGCATTKERKNRGRRVFIGQFFSLSSSFFSFLLTASKVSTRVSPREFPAFSRCTSSRLIISNKRSRRSNGRNPVLRRAVMNLIIFYGRGFRAGCRAIFPFLFEMII